MREMARLVQGVLVDQTAVGVVLLGLVAVLAGLLEAAGPARPVAVLVG